jgi:hypothetical protein
LHGLRSLHRCHVAAGLVKWIGFSSLRLLYSATRDGFSSREFHTRCDGSGATLVLVRSAAGHVFGGYTPTDWGASGRLDCKESFIFHVTCPNGAAPQRYSRRWSSLASSQQRDHHNTDHFSYPMEPFSDNASHPRVIDASIGPTFGARHELMFGSSPIKESLCNDMIINLDSRHGVSHFISFYNNIDDKHVFTPHTIKKPFFPVKFIHRPTEWHGNYYPPAVSVDPGAHAYSFVREGAPNHQVPDSLCVPCFEVADVEVFQVQ